MNGSAAENELFLDGARKYGHDKPRDMPVLLIIFSMMPTFRLLAAAVTACWRVSRPGSGPQAAARPGRHAASMKTHATMMRRAAPARGNAD